jgi:hypothetical protein
MYFCSDEMEADLLRNIHRQEDVHVHAQEMIIREARIQWITGG